MRFQMEGKEISKEGKKDDLKRFEGEKSGRLQKRTKGKNFMRGRLQKKSKRKMDNTNTAEEIGFLPAGVGISIPKGGNLDAASTKRFILSLP